MDKRQNKNKKKKFSVNIKTMGVDIDKNEYREIVLSQSNSPSRLYYNKNQ